ncbi:phage holin family protein [Egicoccus sp. AB-alg2]|uniref:phage holin family protein n=1 Tax=Egicoccus sp. AB-alg2 TaxID=3242693 RepID=UPI00359D6EE1
MSTDHAAGTSPPPASTPADGDPRPTSEIMRSLTANGQALVRKEIELAKLELTEILVARVTAVAMFLGAAVLGLFILGFVGVTGAKALEEVLPPWAAWLIVTFVYILIAAILGLIGKRKLQKPSNTPERTKASVEETVEWAKQRVQP